MIVGLGCTETHRSMYGWEVEISEHEVEQFLKTDLKIVHLNLSKL